jgi:Integrase core domain
VAAANDPAERGRADPGLVNRDFSAEAPGEKMAGDITYIGTWEGWLYLATVIDCATRKVVGWAMGDNYKTPLITAAIEMAARNIGLPVDAVFHSDRGEQLYLGGVRRGPGRPRDPAIRDRVLKVASNARGMFEGVPGLRFKFFTFDEEQQRAVNFYVWDSKEAAQGLLHPRAAGKGDRSLRCRAGDRLRRDR